MARIRSVHPGLFTDEVFVQLSDSAQIFFVGLWTECDDQGVFEWKPITLQMRLRPIKGQPVDPILDELAAANCVACFEHDGRKYGVVRNFVLYQRPKKPTYKHPLPSQWRTFSGIRGDSSEPVGNQYGTGGEESSLMERRGRGGEEVEKEKKDKNALRASSTNGAYEFQAGVIKLNAKDFAKWKSAFGYLDLKAELLSLAKWAGGQPDWWHAVQGALAKRNREQKLKAENVRVAGQRPLTPSGNPWPEGIV